MTDRGTNSYGGKCAKKQKHKGRKRQREEDWLFGPVGVQGNFQGGDSGSEYGSTLSWMHQGSGKSKSKPEVQRP